MPPPTVKRRGAPKYNDRTAFGRSIVDRAFANFEH
jgi:hypothetical protein